MPIDLGGGGIYATITDCRDYIDTADDGVADADLEKVLDAAEHDVDNALITPVADNRSATGLRYDPSALLPWQTVALTRAVCAQVEYRLVMGPDFFIQAQHDRVQGPDFRTFGRLPYLGPKAVRELEGSGLIALVGGGDVAITSSTVATTQRISPIDLLP